MFGWLLKTKDNKVTDPEDFIKMHSMNKAMNIFFRAYSYDAKGNFADLFGRKYYCISTGGGADNLNDVSGCVLELEALKEVINTVRLDLNFNSFFKARRAVWARERVLKSEQHNAYVEGYLARRDNV